MGWVVELDPKMKPMKKKNGSQSRKSVGEKFLCREKKKDIRLIAQGKGSLSELSLFEVVARSFLSREIKSRRFTRMSRIKMLRGPVLSRLSIFLMLTTFFAKLFQHFSIMQTKISITVKIRENGWSWLIRLVTWVFDKKKYFVDFNWRKSSDKAMSSMRRRSPPPRGNYEGPNDRIRSNMRMDRKPNATRISGKFGTIKLIKLT